MNHEEPVADAGHQPNEIGNLHEMYEQSMELPRIQANDVHQEAFASNQVDGNPVVHPQMQSRSAMRRQMNEQKAKKGKKQIFDEEEKKEPKKPQ